MQKLKGFGFKGGTNMKLSTFLAITGGVGVLFGLEFLLLPAFGLQQYGVPTDSHNLM